MTKHADLFTKRQLVALTTFSDLVSETRSRVEKDARTANGSDKPSSGFAATYADAVATYLAFALDKGANYWSSLCGWHSGRDIVMSTFARQVLPMVWDFAEVNPFSNSTGNITSGSYTGDALLMVAGVR
jgi:putative DNA methylase